MAASHGVGVPAVGGYFVYCCMCLNLFDVFDRGHFAWGLLLVVSVVCPWLHVTMSVCQLLVAMLCVAVCVV